MVIFSVRGHEVKYPIIKAWTKHIGKDDHLIRARSAQQNGYGAPAQPSYGAPAEAPASDVVDLHNKEFCVDVSTFQEVVWVERDGEVCETVFVKQCEDKSENVCADVTETRCKVSKTKCNKL